MAKDLETQLDEALKHKPGRQQIYKDVVKVNMWYERSDIEFYDYHAKHFGLPRQAFVRAMNSGLQALEAERPGMIEHLLRNYAQIKPKLKKL